MTVFPRRRTARALLLAATVATLIGCTAPATPGSQAPLPTPSASTSPLPAGAASDARAAVLETYLGNDATVVLYYPAEPGNCD